MSRKGFALPCFLILAAALLLLPVASAQEATGKVVGTISDPQGAVIAGAKVLVTNTGTNISTEATTDKDGVYLAQHLPIGNYKVTVEHQGFRKITTAAYKLEINQTLRIDVKLEIGTPTEVVEVSGDVTQVETYNPTIGNSVTGAAISNMPLNGRNVLSLATLQPGVTETNGPGTYSISGGRPDSVTFLLDGANNNNLLSNAVVYNPNPDTIAEFRILESNYNAEYGRNAGGIISAVTKSGTNEFHGTAYDYNRNDFFAANSFFNKRPLPGAEVTPRDALKRNQFGGTFGGPIKKDKLFFFGSYQGQRQVRGVTQGTRTVFTTRELAGDFSQSPTGAECDIRPSSCRDYVVAFLQTHPYYVPVGGTPEQAIIDPAKIDPIAKHYIDAGFVPSSATGYIRPSGTQKNNNNEVTGKIDYQITPNDRLAGTVGMYRSVFFDPFDGSYDTTAFPGQTSQRRYFTNIAYTKTISATMLNELRLTAQRSYTAQYVPTKKQPIYSDFGINISSDAPNAPPILGFYDSGLNLGQWYQGPAWLINNTYGLTDTLSWVKGKHNLKFGFSYSPYQNNTVYDFIPDGEFDFWGVSTATKWWDNDQMFASGAEFADFLFGMPDNFYQYGRAPSNIRTKSYYFFGQDEWRATKNLVLSLGLRYEYSSPKMDTLGKSFSIIPGSQSTRFTNAPPGLLFPGDAGAPVGANFPDRNDFAPRFGFAWDPFGKGHTSVRGGIGVMYDILKGEDNLQFNGQLPFYGFTDIYPGDFDIGYDFTGASPFFRDPFGTLGIPYPFPSQWPSQDVSFLDNGYLPFGGSAVYFVDAHLRTPYTYQYSLSVQHELTKDLRWEVAYVGNSSHKLTTLVDTDPMILGTRTRILNTQPGAMYYDEEGNLLARAFTDTKTFTNAAHGHYNSLQTSLRKQMSGSGSKFGATNFTLAYTYANNIDNASGFRNRTSRVPYYDPNVFTSLSDSDIRHRLVFSGGWDLPFHQLFGSSEGGFAQKALKGWSLYPILTIRGGFPLDIYAPLSQRSTTPGPSGAGDSYLVRVNLNGSSVLTTSPRSAQTDPNTMGLIFFDGSQFEWDSLAAINNTIVPADQRTYGTLPRNYFRGPGRSNLDLSIAKVTPITERVKFEFRADFFNTFNTPQFGNPSTSPTSSKFGQITSTALPREMQFSARITF